jgi:hypothetical protein
LILSLQYFKKVIINASVETIAAYQATASAEIEILIGTFILYLRLLLVGIKSIFLALTFSTKLPGK